MKLNIDIALLIACLIVGVLIPMMLFGTAFYLKETQEVQVYDHYFVFSSNEFLIVVVGSLMFMTFLIRGLMTRFRKILTRIFLGIGILIVGIIIFAFYEIMNNIS
jgi:hypothetical protein